MIFTKNWQKNFTFIFDKVIQHISLFLLFGHNFGSKIIVWCSFKLRKLSASQQTFICWKLIIRKLKKMWNMFKVDNKDTRMTSMILLFTSSIFWRSSSVSAVAFEEVNVCSVCFHRDLFNYLSDKQRNMSYLLEELIFKLKGTLMQTCKSPHIFKFI